MEKLIQQITEIMFTEYTRASAIHGATNHSAHESYAVIHEELEEACEATERVNDGLTVFWSQIRKNDVDADILQYMQSHAIHAAAEMIQVAAMCYKAGRTEVAK